MEIWPEVKKVRIMGLHALDLIIVVGIALLIFGPKTLQSLSHSAGRGVGQVKDAKEQFMAELPIEDLAEVRETVSQIPLSPQQAARQLMSTSLKPDEKKSEAAKETTGEAIQEEK